MGIIEQLKRKQGFTDAERDMASYILHNVEAVCDMTVRELSGATHTSNSGIIRLCHKLGLSGYGELRIGLARELERRRASMSSIDASRPFGRNESCATIMRSVATLAQEAIEGCYAQLSPEVIDHVAQLVSEAPHVLLYAAGASAISVDGFALSLAKLGIDCVQAGRYDDYASASYLASEGDMALFVSYGGRMFKLFDNLVEFLKGRGCTCVIVTAMDPYDPLLAEFDHVITVPRREGDVGAIGPYFSQASFRYVLGCVYGRVYSLNYASNDERKQLVDSAGRAGRF